jgi:hypothetical protein
MSTPNVNVLLTSTIAGYDNLAANTPLLSMINPGSLTFGALATFYNEYFQALSTGSALNLPAPTSYVAWVRNRHASANLGISVTFLVIGVQQCFIGPGDVYFWFNASKTSGYTALSLTGIAGTVPCEVYLAG